MCIHLNGDLLIKGHKKEKKMHESKMTAGS